MRDLPIGTVTFLFTDIEGSTRLLQRLGDRYREVVDRHGGILREAIASGGGMEVHTEGDSFFAVFPTPRGPSLPQSRLSGPWPLTPGPRVTPSGCGWAFTLAKRFWVAMTTSGSMSTWPRASPPRATAGRSSSPRQPGALVEHTLFPFTWRPRRSASAISRTRRLR